MAKFLCILSNSPMGWIRTTVGFPPALQADAINRSATMGFLDNDV